jgi:hemoglobin
MPASTRATRSRRRCGSDGPTVAVAFPGGLTRNTEGEDEVDRRLDRRTVAKSAGVVAGAAALGLFPRSAEADVASHKPGGNTSLYDRLGGYFGIALVVNRFSDQIIINPVLNRNPALRAWNETEAEARLPGLKFGRTLWIAAAAGGPFVYTGLPLAEAHAEFNLTAEEFAEVGAEIVRALDFFAVPEREQQELMRAYQASMSDVVTE